MRILILRGAHNSEMLKDITQHVKGANLVFVEAIGSRNTRAKWIEYSLALAMSDQFSAEQVKLAEEETNLLGRLMWELRGSGTVVIPVDDTPPERSNYVDDLEEYTSGHMKIVPDNIDDLLKANDYERLYAAFDETFGATAEWVRRRDDIVAKQVHEVVGVMKSHSVSTEEIVIVQGAQHESLQYLEQLFPEAEFKQEYYNEEGVALLNDSPGMALLAAKIKDPHKPLVRRDLDLYILFMTDPTFASIIDNAPKTIDTFTHSNAMYHELTEAYRNFIGKHMDLSDEEVHACLMRSLA